MSSFFNFGSYFNDIKIKKLHDIHDNPGTTGQVLISTANWSTNLYTNTLSTPISSGLTGGGFVNVYENTSISFATSSSTRAIQVYLTTPNTNVSTIALYSVTFGFGSV